MAKPWLGKVGALFHYMHSLPMDMKRGCIGILIHPHTEFVGKFVFDCLVVFIVICAIFAQN